MYRGLFALLIGILFLLELSAQRDSIYHDRQLGGLIVALDDSLENVKVAALKILADSSWNGNIGKKNLHRISMVTGEKSIALRSSAIDVLGSQTNLETKYLKKIAGYLTDANADVRRSAIYALGSQENLTTNYLFQISRQLIFNDGNSSMRVQVRQANTVGDFIWNIIKKEPIELLMYAFPYATERSHWSSTNYAGYEISEKESVQRIRLYEYSGGIDSMVYLLKWFCRPGSYPP